MTSGMRFRRITVEPTAATEARRLLSKWTQLARNHLPVAFGCSCGLSFNHLRLQDFERDILDYVFDKYTRTQTEIVLDMLRYFAGYHPGGKGSIAALLSSMALQTERRGKNERLALLADLESSIDSSQNASSVRVAGGFRA